MITLLDVPSDLRPTFPFAYPAHQKGPLIEEYVHQALLQRASGIATSTHWRYVPIYWTSYAVRRPRVRGIRRLFGHPSDRRLNDFLQKTLRPGVNYFTISQHDDGLHQRGRCEPRVPILEFSCGGTGDIPMPLLCDPHMAPPDFKEQKRDIRASFLGQIKDSPIPYPCRDGMVAALAGREGYLVEHVDNRCSLSATSQADDNQRKTNRFVEILSRSVFALCPRGYGKTSFRMYEAMQLGCIPVYIYDEPWLPYTDVLDWNEFAVLAPLTEVSRLREILDSHSAAMIRAKQDRLREVYPRFFTMEATVEQLLRYVAAEKSSTSRKNTSRVTCAATG